MEFSPTCRWTDPSPNIISERHDLQMNHKCVWRQRIWEPSGILRVEGGWRNAIGMHVAATQTWREIDEDTRVLIDQQIFLFLTDETFKTLFISCPLHPFFTDLYSCLSPPPLHSTVPQQSIASHSLFVYPNLSTGRLSSRSVGAVDSETLWLISSSCPLYFLTQCHTFSQCGWSSFIIPFIAIFSITY